MGAEQGIQLRKIAPPRRILKSSASDSMYRPHYSFQTRIRETLKHEAEQDFCVARPSLKKEKGRSPRFRP
jgi:hypothetical protein